MAMTDHRMASDEPEPRDATGCAGATPGRATGVPHWWQNLAPGASSVPQAPQATAPNGAPHEEQNLPDAACPHVGHGVAVGVGVGVGPVAGDSLMTVT